MVDIILDVCDEDTVATLDEKLLEKLEVIEEEIVLLELALVIEGDVTVLNKIELTEVVLVLVEDVVVELEERIMLMIVVELVSGVVFEVLL